MTVASSAQQKELVMVKVFLVDDHEVVRRGLADLLASDPELEIVGEAGSVSEAKAEFRRCGPTSPFLTCAFRTGTGSNCAATWCPIFRTCGA